MIGRSLPRPDALGKVTGAAKYPADLVRDDHLRLKVVFAHRAHARILAIDDADALAVPGVLAVLTAKDVPYNRYGLVRSDQPLLCDDVVRFHGDRVALVVGETQEAADAGARALRVTYEDLPIVDDARRATEPGAPRVHAERASNVLEHARIRRGDVDAAFAHAAVVVEGEFTTSWQEHAYLQPDAGIAYYEGDRLVVETAGQWLHEDRRQIAEMLALDTEHV
ncbi:MAG: molybdopterin cofactor-binding domain-containing protein, partial [Candidatus Aquilonibacter sp.]